MEPPGINPVIGRTEAEAKEKIAQLASPAGPEPTQIGSQAAGFVMPALALLG